MNPFFYGTPASLENFIGRRQVIRRIVGRLANHGQSTALVGEPRLGKSSLLHYLEAPAQRVGLYGDHASQLIFSSLSSESLDSTFTPARFWQQVLYPLQHQLIDLAPTTGLAQHYQLCQRNNFGVFTLENLFRSLHAHKHRLVLLLDEFDQLLHHPILNSAEFFGGLRALASRSNGALVLVVASRLPLAVLNAETQVFNPTGSPYFNIFAEFTLGSFTDAEVHTLFERADSRFTPADRRYLTALAGHHPYLLQAAASTLWDAYDEGLDEAGRHGYVYDRLVKEHTHHFADTWRAWPPVVRQAFTAVALVNAKGKLFKREFDLNDFLESLSSWEPELKGLAQVGMVRQHIAHTGEWRVAQSIMLAWLFDELRREIRQQSDLAQWLQRAEVEHFWKRGQREQVLGAMRALGNKADDLVKTFVMAFGMGLGDASAPGQ